MPRITPSDRREAILDAAREEFSRNGFARARMDDIAGRVGISKAALYLQFDSKEAIFYALAEGLIAETIPVLVPAEFGDVPAAMLLRGFVTMALERLTRSDIAFVPRLVIGEGGSFPDLVRYYHDHAIIRIMELIEAVIRHGVDRGEFSCADPYHTARSVAGGVILSALWRVVFEPVGARPLDVAAMTEAHVSVLIDGLLIREEKP
ncbi:MAG: TetR/AcrR family transcriptional regulator [Blastomonas sp.]